MIWRVSGGVHQEIWYDNGSGWKKGGEWNRASCGHLKTSTAPDPNQEIEFRTDCSNATFSGTDVAVIRPPGGFYLYPSFGFFDGRMSKMKMPRNS
jgi:hypothetical protein